MPNDLRNLRHRFQQAGLPERDAPPEPVSLLHMWLSAAADADIYLHNSMVVSTVDSRGRPSSRTVLLKGVDERGLVFFTGYNSRKGREIASNGNVACLLVWPDLARQIRVTGIASRVPPEESDSYFATRERGAQIEAWASEQSARIAGRDALEKRFKEFDSRFAGRQVPRPEHWGGYRVSLEVVEFWQGRPDRMHDRLLYERGPGGAWHMCRLAP